jgi:hypothetical protein
MADGLIQDNMAQPGNDSQINSQVIKQNIKMPPELQEAYERVVIAGMKVMFSKESHDFMLRQLQQGGSLGEKLGKGVAGLLLVLFKQSNETMPPQVIIPAGVELVAQAADFLKEAGMEQPTNDDIGQGIQIMISIILEKFGVQPEQMQQMLNQYSNQNIPAQNEMGGQNA